MSVQNLSDRGYGRTSREDGRHLRSDKLGYMLGEVTLFEVQCGTGGPLRKGRFFVRGNRIRFTRIVCIYRSLMRIETQSLERLRQRFDIYIHEVGVWQCG